MEPCFGVISQMFENVVFEQSSISEIMSEMACEVDKELA